MMDPDERQVEAPSKRLPVHHADEQRANQPGRRGHGDTVETTHSHTGLIQGSINHRSERLHMGPAGEFRHDTAEDRVHIL